MDLDGIGGRMARAWSSVLQYVRTGEPAYHTIFGMPFWEDLDAHPEIRASFDAMIGPAGHGTPSPHFPISAGWDAIQTVVDVGGGTGAMLAEVLRAFPHIRGTLVDLPKTAPSAEANFQAAGVSERAEMAAQSFFDPLPGGADVYILRGVINDWPDREAAAILKRCAESARPSGSVVILKGTVPDDAPRVIEIETILLGGKQRTVSELQALAREAGMEVVAAGQQTGGYFYVECRPVQD
jgi:precorrin-6B methylase 2